jgi:hypothetical protein
MRGTCFYCGAHGRVEIDHIVCRVDGIPVHEGLIVESCGPCNRRRFAFLKVAGIGSRDPSDAECLRRTATFLAIRRSPLDEELADFLTEIAESLERAQ